MGDTPWWRSWVGAAVVSLFLIATVGVLGILGLLDDLADWDWQTIAAIATALGVIVALLGLIRQDKNTRDGLQQDRIIAEATAERAEAAARLTQEYTLRVVEALETMAARGGPGMAPIDRKVKWSLEHHSGDMFILTNEGGATAHHVTVTAHESLPLIELDNDQELDPGEAMTFIAAPSMGTADLTITVLWEEEVSEGVRVGRDWKYPLPLGPPRARVRVL